MNDLLPAICGHCKHVHEDRYCRQRMLLEQRPSPGGVVSVYARLCDWCAKDRPDLIA